MTSRRKPDDLYVGVTQTAIGPVAVVATKTRPVRIILNAPALARVRHQFPDARPDTGELALSFKMIDEALAGRKVPLALDHLDAGAFSLRVWEATRAIPAGKVTTYAALARRIARPRAARAVGNALGTNPLPILVPCHRVVRSDRTLGGFTGGIDMKVALLRHERVPLVGQRSAISVQPSHGG